MLEKLCVVLKNGQRILMIRRAKIKIGHVPASVCFLYGPGATSSSIAFTLL